MEVVLALLIIGMLATLAVPYLRPGVGAGALKARANEIASLLRRDRNMALFAGRDSSVSIDAGGSTVQSDQLGQRIVMPRGLTLRLLPDRAGGVAFTADGRSSGGRIVVTAADMAVAIDINRLTAAINVSEIRR